MGTADDEYSPKIAKNLKPNSLKYFKKTPHTAINSIDNWSAKNSISHQLGGNPSTRPGTANIMLNSSTLRNRQFRRSSGGSAIPGTDGRTSFRVSEDFKGNSMIEFVKFQNNPKTSDRNKSQRSSKHRY